MSFCITTVQGSQRSVAGAWRAAQPCSSNWCREGDFVFTALAFLNLAISWSLDHRGLAVGVAPTSVDPDASPRRVNRAGAVLLKLLRAIDAMLGDGLAGR